MKKIFYFITLLIFLSPVVSFSAEIRGAEISGIFRDSTIILEKNKKLVGFSVGSHENIWTMVRDMRPEEKAETYTVYDDPRVGNISRITIIEKR